jgi:hypothetical protein
MLRGDRTGLMLTEFRADSFDKVPGFFVNVLKFSDERLPRFRGITVVSSRLDNSIEGRRRSRGLCFVNDNAVAKRSRRSSKCRPGIRGEGGHESGNARRPVLSSDPCLGTVGITQPRSARSSPIGTLRDNTRRRVRRYRRCLRCLGFGSNHWLYRYLWGWSGGLGSACDLGIFVDSPDVRDIQNERCMQTDHSNDSE